MARGVLSQRGTVANPNASSALPVASYAATPAAGALVRRADGSLAIGTGSSAVSALPAVDDRRQTFGYVDNLFARAIPAPCSAPDSVPAVSNATSNPISGGVAYTYNTANVTKIGCYPVTVSTSFIQNQVNALTENLAAPWAVEFTSTSDDHVLTYRCPTGATSVRLWIFVDGRPVGRSAVKITGLTAGSTYYYRFTFTTAKTRRITIHLCAADFGGITVATGQSIAAATPVETVKGLFLGDSWVANDADASWPNNFAWLAGKALGWQTYLCGQSGTGYVNAGTGTAYGSAGRQTPITASAPDYIVIPGSINDNGLSGQQTAAASLYSSLASALPSAKLIVVGPQPVNGGYASASMTNHDAIKTAALAAPNVLGFIDPIAYRWIDGYGAIDAPAGVGNADFYVGHSTTHPSNIGTWYYAHRVVEEIVRLLDKNGLL
jgi:hypothetical protein